MTERDNYRPGPAGDAEIEKRGETWTLVIARRLRHAPDRVWQALVDPAQLHQWAPFDADARLDAVGATVKLSTVGAPSPQVAETVVKRADPPKALEYDWGGNALRWELEAVEDGTRLTLWHSIDRRFIAMGAAGWHICLDVLDHLVAGQPLGRIVGPDAMAFGWPRLLAEYSKRFGLEPPKWPPQGASDK